MTVQGMSYIADCMESLNVPYSFHEWKGDIAFPFFVGDITPITRNSEDGLEECTFSITGTNEGVILPLIEVAERIKQYFTTTSRTAIFPDGSGIAVTFETCNPIPTNDENYHRVEINLNVKEWCL